MYNYEGGDDDDDDQELHGMAARRIGVTGLPPLGCMPIARTLFDHKSRDCVSRFNSDAEAFNKKLNVAATDLQKQLPGIKLAIFDIYKPFYEMITDPAKYGTLILSILKSNFMGHFATTNKLLENIFYLEFMFVYIRLILTFINLITITV